MPGTTAPGAPGRETLTDPREDCLEAFIDILDAKPPDFLEANIGSEYNSGVAPEFQHSIAKRANRPAEQVVLTLIDSTAATLNRVMNTDLPREKKWIVANALDINPVEARHPTVMGAGRTTNTAPRRNRRYAQSDDEATLPDAAYIIGVFATIAAVIYTVYRLAKRARN